MVEPTRHCKGYSFNSVSFDAEIDYYEKYLAEKTTKNEHRLISEIVPVDANVG